MSAIDKLPLTGCLKRHRKSVQSQFAAICLPDMYGKPNTVWLVTGRHHPVWRVGGYQRAISAMQVEVCVSHFQSCAAL